MNHNPFSAQKMLAWAMAVALFAQYLTPFTAVSYASEDVAPTEAVTTTDAGTSADTNADTAPDTGAENSSTTDSEESADTPTASENTEETYAAETSNTTEENADTSSSPADTEENTTKRTDSSDATSPEISAENTENAEKSDTARSEYTDTQLSQMILSLVAQKLGIDLASDADFYAEQAGIENYRGNTEQNEALKAWLIENRNQLSNFLPATNTQPISEPIPEAHKSDLLKSCLEVPLRHIEESPSRSKLIPMKESKHKPYFGKER